LRRAIYQRQIEETVQLLMERGGWSNHHRLCYQSKWGEPMATAVACIKALHQLSAQRVREVCIVPVAFVSDHVETLVRSIMKRARSAWT